MTDQEILQKVVEKAVNNGWNMKIHKIDKVRLNDYGDFEWDDYDSDNFRGTFIIRPREVLLDMDFAKAFWGEEKICERGHQMFGGDIKCKQGESDISFGCNADASNLRLWQYHLQQMVLCENPIKYLESFL